MGRGKVHRFGRPDPACVQVSKFKCTRTALEGLVCGAGDDSTSLGGLHLQSAAAIVPLTAAVSGDI